MKRPLLLALGWLMSAAGLYAALVMLELYWNLFDWQPKLDLRALGLIIGIIALLAAIRFLARASNDRFSQVVSLVACLAMFGLGVYVSLPEPMTQGLFAREAPSPFWYRAGRLALLALPSVFWGLGLRRRWKHAARTS